MLPEEAGRAEEVVEGLQVVPPGEGSSEEVDPARRWAERWKCILTCESLREGGAPHLQALLLQERVDMAMRFSRFAASSHLEAPFAEIIEVIEANATWTQADGELRFGREKYVTLEDAWREAAGRIECGEVPNEQALAEIAGVKRGTWYQWVHRARVQVLKWLDDERTAQDLFLNWPQVR